MIFPPIGVLFICPGKSEFPKKATETKEWTEFSKEVLKVKSQVLKAEMMMMKEQFSWISSKLQEVQLERRREKLYP